MSWGELRAHGSEKGVSSEWRCRSGNGISGIEGSSESVKVWNELPAEPGMKRSKSCGTADPVLNRYSTMRKRHQVRKMVHTAAGACFWGCC